MTIFLRAFSKAVSEAAAASAIESQLSNWTRNNATLVVGRSFSSTLKSDLLLVDARSAPADFSQSAFVYPNVVSESEEEAILMDLRAKMKRRRYERGHWDAVIVKYKEIELFEEEGDELLTQTTKDVLKRIRSQLSESIFANDPSLTWLPCHAIELHADGELKPHVDSVRFSGDLVAGLSLGSSSIMRLKPASENEDYKEVGDDNKDEAGRRSTPTLPSDEKGGFVDLLLQPRSLYALTGPSRYLYTHELLQDETVFPPTKTLVRREDRFSVIFRDAKKEPNAL